MPSPLQVESLSCSFPVFEHLDTHPGRLPMPALKRAKDLTASLRVLVVFCAGHIRQTLGLINAVSHQDNSQFELYVDGTGRIGAAKEPEARKVGRGTVRFKDSTLPCFWAP